jgi:O-antigen/teichoic acid export membrane protein
MSVEDQTGQEHLGRRAAAGVLWLAAQKWAIRVSGFATLIVLTRHISPTEFGIVAAAMTVIPTIYLLADLGFSTYLLQADHIDQESLSTAFWASVTAGAVLAAGLWVAAPFLAGVFRAGELVTVLRALVLAILPTVLSAVPLALLRRAMRFRAVAVQSLVAAVLAQVVAVVLALRGEGVWALVGQVLATQWVMALLAWRSARWVPSWSLSPRTFRHMAAFGLRVSSVDIVGFARMWAESWIITVSLGPAALGLLSIAQRLVLAAQELTAVSLVPVSTVVFAKVRESPQRLRTSYVKALAIAYAMVSPVMIVIIVTAPILVPHLFGAAWRASAAPTQALAVVGIITIGAALDHGLFYGLGRPGAWLAYAVVADAMWVASAAVAVRWGLIGVAIGYVVVAVLATASRWVLVGRLLELRARTVGLPFTILVVPAAGSVVAGLLVMRLVQGLDPTWVGLAIAAGATVLANVLLLRVVAGKLISDALGILPLPDRYVHRVERWLRLGTQETA